MLTDLTRPPPAPYFSFLICSGQSGRQVHVYFNGQPIGIIESGAFSPATLAPNQRPVMLRDLGNPCPFDTVVQLKARLHEIVDAFEIDEPKPEPKAAP